MEHLDKDTQKTNNYKKIKQTRIDDKCRRNKMPKEDS